MIRLLVMLFLATLAIVSATATYARMGEEAKIEELIASVRATPEGTMFIRNGREYGCKKAAEHLRTKYAFGKKHAATAELFINNIASRSSVTGAAYTIRFPDGATVTAREFFTEELKKINTR